MQRAHADSQFRRLQPPMLRQDGYVRLISMARHQRRHQQSWYTLRRQPRELYRPAGLAKPCTAPGLQQHAAHKAQRRFSARGDDGLRGQHRDAQVCHVWANNRRAVVLPLGLPECKDPSLMACAEVNLPAAAGKSDDARQRGANMPMPGYGLSSAPPPKAGEAGRKLAARHRKALVKGHAAGGYFAML